MNNERYSFNLNEGGSFWIRLDLGLKRLDYNIWGEKNQSAQMSRGEWTVARIQIKHLLNKLGRIGGE